MTDTPRQKQKYAALRNPDLDANMRSAYESALWRLPDAEEINRPLLDVADNLARDVHQGESYAGGSYYKLHIKPVVGLVHTDGARFIATLHDVVEHELKRRLQAHSKPEQAEFLGHEEDAIAAILEGLRIYFERRGHDIGDRLGAFDALTKREYEKNGNYSSYIERICRHATKTHSVDLLDAKIADITCNVMPENNPPPERQKPSDRARLGNYEKTLPRLREVRAAIRDGRSQRPLLRPAGDRAMTPAI